MLESIVLGIIQGTFEWLPISSEGVIVLLKVNLFKSSLDIENLISFALFLHLGTFLAALIYFRKEVYSLLKALFDYKKTSQENKKLLHFYILTAIISGFIGLVILKGLSRFGKDFSFTGKGITLLVGFMLLITAFFQFKKKEKGIRQAVDLKTGDAVLLSLVQGFSILPGLSRSGLTVSAFLLRGFDEAAALKLSFIMSLPVVLGANIILNLKGLAFSWEYFFGLFFSFLFGLLMIHLLLKLANKLNFSWFVLLFGLITILSAFI